MTKADKENLNNKQLTDSMIISCLAACEPVISRNAYNEKKWSNYYVCSNQSAGDNYKLIRMEWTRYREKLRSLLLPVYSMKMIIQMTKGCADKATQKEVKVVMDLIDKNDYTLL